LGTMTACRCARYRQGVQQPAWINRDDAWWERVAVLLALAIGLIGAFGQAGAWARVEVVGVALVSAAGFEAKARWTRLPVPLLAVWTFSPPIILNLRHRGEATLMVLVVAVGVVVLTEPDRRLRWALSASAILAPAVIHAATRQPGGWPFWMMGIVFGWLSGEQMRRFRSLIVELETTRERLAVQAVHLERRRLAAELHDLVGHSLTVVMLHVTGARPPKGRSCGRRASAAGRRGDWPGQPGRDSTQRGCPPRPRRGQHGAHAQCRRRRRPDQPDDSRQFRRQPRRLGRSPGGGSMISVVLVDDQALVRAGMQRILAEDEGFLVVAECSDGAEALAAVAATTADVILMDIPHCSSAKPP
jgi:hypothetical protein